MYLICDRTAPWILTAYQQFSPRNTSWNPSSRAGTTTVSMSSGLMVEPTLSEGQNEYSPTTSARNGSTPYTRSPATFSYLLSSSTSTPNLNFWETTPSHSSDRKNV